MLSLHNSAVKTAVHRVQFCMTCFLSVCMTLNILYTNVITSVSPVCLLLQSSGVDSVGTQVSFSSLMYKLSAVRLCQLNFMTKSLVVG